MVISLLDVITIISSLSALVLSIISFSHSRASVVKDFFAQVDSPDMRAYRKTIYDIYNNEKDPELRYNQLLAHEKDVTQTISCFEFWALMVKKHYLPRWAFQASSKFVAITLYNKVKPYIEYRRKDQPDYAKHFEWLISRLNK